jgi:ligand-binding sensor domain-containing protein/signal transduction histidine kinase
MVGNPARNDWLNINRKSSGVAWWRPALLACLQAWLLFPAVTALALDPDRSVYQFNCRNWTRQNGLPADRINSITQTKDGYLWLGTEGGLVRFDGQEFKVFPIELASAQGQNVRKLITARDGGLRFSINNGGFGSYRDRQFSPVGDARWSQPGQDAITLLEARDGSLWTGSEQGLGRWSAKNPRDSFMLDLTNSPGMVLAFCEDAGGRVWMGTAEHGLFCWAEEKLAAIPGGMLPEKNIFALAADGTNRIWIGTDTGLRFCANNQIFSMTDFNWEVKTLLVDRQGTLWAGTTGGGLARYAKGKFDYFTKADGLGSDYITDLFEDAEGSLWVGTRDGLSQMCDVKIPIYTRKEGLPDGSAHSVAVSKRGGLWIGDDNGLCYFDGETANNALTNYMRYNQYIKLCFEARNGEVYAEDGEKNISVFSGDRLIARITNSVWVSAFGEDADGILVGRGTGNALYRIQNGSFVHYQYRHEPGPDYYWINNFCQARDGATWVASKNGIYRLQGGNSQRWSINEGLSGDIGLWVCQDTNDSIWVGLTKGIARITNGHVKNITPDEGLADNWIYAIVPDDHGYFWFSSSRGVFRVARQELNDCADGKLARVNCDLFNGLEAVKSIGRSDQENSGCKTADGRIWFPCPWGVLAVDPAQVPRNLVAPPVHIDRVIANGRTMLPGRDLLLPPGQKQLEFEFTALSFIAPEKIQYRYQLEGFENDWVTKLGRSRVSYNNLKPGRYTFHVTAANADGLWNPVNDSVAVELRPYFHQTLGFYFLCGALGATLLAILYVMRVRHLEFRQRALQQARDQLESEVKKRTAELAHANASLQHEVQEHRRTSAQLVKRTRLLETEITERERMQNEIELVHRRLLEISRQAGMAEVATNVLHNVGNVLNSVNISAAVVADNTRKSKLSSLARVAALLQEHAASLPAFLTSDPQGRHLPEYLKELASHLAAEQQTTLQELEQLQKNIEHIKDIVTRQQSYATTSGVTEAVNLPELVEDALRMTFGALARAEFQVVREFAAVTEVVAEKHKVLQILVNLIRNAKYACDDSGRKDKQLRIKVSAVDEGVAIAVIDNGVGIARENLTRIFSHGFTTRKGGHGFGLHSGALAASELGGTLTAESDGPGQGATFTLKLPLHPPKEP